MQAEKIGKLSLSESKVLESVAGISECKLRRKVEGVPEQQVFNGCRFCGGKSRHSKDKCPANERKCHDCGLIGHFKRQCKFIKKPQKKEGSADNKEEAHSVIQCKI